MNPKPRMITINILPLDVTGKFERRPRIIGDHGEQGIQKRLDGHVEPAAPIRSRDVVLDVLCAGLVSGIRGHGDDEGDLFPPFAFARRGQGRVQDG